MLIRAEVEPEIHVDHLLNKCQKRTFEKPSLETVQSPVKHHVSFISNAHRAAVVCTFYQRSSMCHSRNAGKNVAAYHTHKQLSKRLDAARLSLSCLVLKVQKLKNIFITISVVFC